MKKTKDLFSWNSFTLSMIKNKMLMPIKVFVAFCLMKVYFHGYSEMTENGLAFLIVFFVMSGFNVFTEDRCLINY